MVKVLVTDNKAKNVSAAIISGLKRQVNELNSAEYNYADILKSITIFTEYSKLIGTYLGIDVNIKFDIQHSSKVRLNMVNNTIPKVRLSDLNAALRSNYSILIQIVGQIESIYNKAFTDYKSMIALYDIEKVEYAKFKSESLSEIDSLMEALNNTEIITNDDIDEALHEAQIETEAQIEEATKNTEDIAQEVWDTNKGYETSSQIQEDAMKAAEEYAENNAQAHAAEEAANELSKANSELEDAISARDDAQRAWDDAMKSSTDAVAESNEKDAAARADELQAHGIANAIANTEGYDESKTTVGDLTAGTFLSPNGESVVTVTHNDDGTTTITTDDSKGSHTSVTYSDTDSAKSTYDNAVDTARDSRAEADEAKANADQKLDDLKEATDNLEKATEEAINAQTKAEEAQQNYDDASIQYATDDELETGWQNDPTNPSDDDYGDDNWGDWSDIIGEGIEDSGGDDTDDDDGGDDDE